MSEEDPPDPKLAIIVAQHEVRIVQLEKVCEKLEDVPTQIASLKTWVKVFIIAVGAPISLSLLILVLQQFFWH